MTKPDKWDEKLEGWANLLGAQGRNGLANDLRQAAAALRDAERAGMERVAVRIEELEKALAGAKETLDMIAGQHLKDEGDCETVDDGDYEGAYDEIVRLARTAARAIRAAKEKPDA